MNEQNRAYRVLAMNTLAFTVCFAVWMMNGVLVTFLVGKGLFSWDKTQIGWLIGIPVLTGSVLRLPVGVLTDKYGGRAVFTALMALTVVPTWLAGYANTYPGFLLAGLGFGLSGASFAVGVAYTSLWFPPERQGTVLGIFGMGNIGAALTSMGAPLLLKLLTDNGADLEGWRLLPKLYAAILALTALLFWSLTETKKIEDAKGLSFAQRLAPLKNLRVWRFGLYYFFVFGGFVSLAQWLVPYYVNVYSMSIATAGLMAASFSLPAGVIRAFGGWLSDIWGPRSVLYLVFGAGVLLLVLLLPPRMEIRAPGQGIMAGRPGTVSAVSEREIVVGKETYSLNQPEEAVRPEFRLGIHSGNEGFLLLPNTLSWQEPAVKAGDAVVKGQLIARGVTRIYFQANKWIFTGILFLVGIMMGIGSAAVYKHIPNYFPASVGVVGGIVGVLGGLGGFFNPIIFGYLLKATGIWTTCWMFLALVGLACLVWMHLVVRRLMNEKAPALVRQMDEGT